MLISEDKKLVFIHVQKTGGASFSMLLKNNIPDLKSVLRQHATVREAKEILGDNWDDYYKIAFVRNPWDRLVSWYSMITQYGKKLTWNEKLVNLVKRERHNKIWQYVLIHSDSFEDFICNCADATNRAGWKPFLYNQTDYLVDEYGNILVDYIGRYENYAEDVKNIFQQIKIEITDIPHLNKSSRLDYKSYYNDVTRDIVALRFRKDIVNFNYKY